MIKATGLNKNYGTLTALDLSDLEIFPGESFGLVGNNGAGKTTFFSLLLDLIRPSAGNVSSKALNVMGNEDWKSYTGSYLDEGFLIDFLNPEEYFEFVSDLYGIDHASYLSRLDDFAEFFNGEILGRGKLIRELSKGNQKKVGIAAALLPNPEVVILDEPFPNLDPSSVNRLKKILNQTREAHDVTFLISSHNLNHITDVCDRIVVLEKGRIVRDLQTDTSTLQELEEYFAI
ncbi:MAG: ABC transporter ATP-binding protein [Acidobacteriota bacterium]|nr:MAG: ABC transporter ATP-binding protein [Acidobacteriota bacterium]